MRKKRRDENALKIEGHTPKNNKQETKSPLFPHTEEDKQSNKALHCNSKEQDPFIIIKDKKRNVKGKQQIKEKENSFSFNIFFSLEKFPTVNTQLS